MASGGDTGSGQDLVITRVFDAPRELVFRMWTEPEHVKHWWGPGTFTVPFCEIDLRSGGRFLRCMRSPEGHDLWVMGVFCEVVVPERLVFTDSFTDTKGNVVPAEYYGLQPELPLKRLVTVTFDKEGSATRVTLRHTGIPPGADRELTQRGWSDSLRSLAGYLGML